MIADLESWIGIPYELGGRSRDGIDCLGITRVVLSALGVPDEQLPDPWETLRAEWIRSTLDLALARRGVPAGWALSTRHLAMTPADCAIVVMSAACNRGSIGVGAVYGGRLWTARPLVGVVALPWSSVWSAVESVWERTA